MSETKAELERLLDQAQGLIESICDVAMDSDLEDSDKVEEILRLLES